MLSAQKIHLREVVEELYCDSLHSYDPGTIYLIKEWTSSEFDYDKVDSTCVDLIIVAQEKEMLAVLRKRKEVLLLTCGEPHAIPSEENAFQCVLSLDKVKWKWNKKGIHRLDYYADYQVAFVKNADTQTWEVEYERGALRRR